MRGGGGGAAARPTAGGWSGAWGGGAPVHRAQLAPEDLAGAVDRQRLDEGDGPDGGVLGDGVLGRRVPLAQHDVGALHDDLADGAVRHLVVVGIDELDAVRLLLPMRGCPARGARV